MFSKLKFLKKLGLGGNTKSMLQSIQEEIHFEERPRSQNHINQLALTLDRDNNQLLFALQQELHSSIDHLRKLEPMLQKVSHIVPHISKPGELDPESTDNIKIELHQASLSVPNLKSAATPIADDIEISLKNI